MIKQLDFTGYEDIPFHTRQELRRWVEHGMYPGSFLTAVLCNDLMAAVGRADADNQLALASIARFIYNRVPSNAWGSAKHMREYLSANRHVEEA